MNNLSTFILLTLFGPAVFAQTDKEQLVLNVAKKTRKILNYFKLNNQVFVKDKYFNFLLVRAII